MENRLLTACMFTTVALSSISTGYADENTFRFRFDAQKYTKQNESVIAAKWNGLSPLTVDTGLTDTYQNLSSALSKAENVRTYWGGGVDISLLGGTLLGVGEISDGKRFTGSAFNAKKMDAHFHKLGLRSGYGNWSYGVGYQSVGKDYAGIYKIIDGQKKDSSAYHLWLDWRLSDFDFRARFSDSVDRESQKTSRISQLVDIASSYTLPYFSATRVAISYALGRRWNSQQHSQLAVNREQLSQIKATLKHSNNSFAYTLGSGFSWDKPEINRYGWHQVEEYFVNLRYSVLPALSLSPSYNMRFQRFPSELLKSGKDSTAATLALSYRPVKQPYKLMASVDRKTEVMTLSGAEKSTIQARLKLDWTVKHSSEKESQFSLSFEQKHRINHVSGAANTEKLRFMLFWKLLSA